MKISSWKVLCLFLSCLREVQAFGPFSHQPRQRCLDVSLSFQHEGAYNGDDKNKNNNKETSAGSTSLTQAGQALQEASTIWSDSFPSSSAARRLLDEAGQALVDLGRAPQHNWEAVTYAAEEAALTLLLLSQASSGSPALQKEYSAASGALRGIASIRGDDHEADARYHQAAPYWDRLSQSFSALAELAEPNLQEEHARPLSDSQHAHTFQSCLRRASASIQMQAEKYPGNGAWE